MSLTRKPPIQHQEQVGLLISAIEQGARHSAAVSSSRHNQLIVRHLPAATIYAALAHQLGQKAEGVRQELHKYREGLRTPRAAKIVALVDAASRLGWIDESGSKTGASELVAWCRGELERQSTERLLRVTKDAARRRSRLENLVDELVTATFEDAAVGEHDIEVGTALVAELLTTLAGAAVQELTRRERHWNGQSAKRLREGATSVRTVLLRAATAVSGAYHRRNAEEELEKVALLDDLHNRAAAENMLLRARSIGYLRLEARALKLGIGRPQLDRVLEQLAAGTRLTPDDMARARELLGGLRPMEEWNKPTSRR